MKWYDIFSSYYDLSLGKVYDSGRSKAIHNLALEPGMTVLDIACGTGANFSHLKKAEHKITIIGVDYSKGMLSKARKKVKKNKWEDIHLIQAVADDISQEFLNSKIGHDLKTDRVICTLGLSVLPDWEEVLLNALALLNENGIISIMDVYAEKRNINTPIVELSARADVNRQIWQKLKMITADFKMEYLPANKVLVGGSLFVANGKKKADY